MKEPCEVLLISDSQYLIKGLKWMRGWKAKGWSLSRKKFRPVANADLWKTLDELAAQHNITGQWVRGHNGHADNERCNELAEAQAARGPITGNRSGNASPPNVGELVRRSA